MTATTHTDSAFIDPNARCTIQTWDEACGWDGPECDFSKDDALTIVARYTVPARIYEGARLAWNNRSVNYESVDKNGDEWDGVFIIGDFPPAHFSTVKVFGRLRTLDTANARRANRGWSVPFA